MREGLGPHLDHGSPLKTTKLRKSDSAQQRPLPNWQPTRGLETSAILVPVDLFVHIYMDVSIGEQLGELRPNAAMMAKVTDHPWTLDELYDAVGNYG